MTHACSIDRFEGDSKQIAVLVFDDGTTIDVPRSLLPAGAGEGEALKLSFEPDPETTRRVAEETRALQDELRKTDPGGDIVI